MLLNIVLCFLFCDKILVIKVVSHNITQPTRLYISRAHLPTSNVTGRDRGSKRKPRAGYRVPSVQWMCYVPSVIFLLLDIVVQCNGPHIFIVECGIARFLYDVRVFDVRASSSPL